MDLEEGILLLLLSGVTCCVFPRDLEAFRFTVEPHKTRKRPIIHLSNEPRLQPHTPRVNRHLPDRQTGVDFQYSSVIMTTSVTLFRKIAGCGFGKSQTWHSHYNPNAGHTQLQGTYTHKVRTRTHTQQLALAGLLQCHTKVFTPPDFLNLNSFRNSYKQL